MKMLIDIPDEWKARIELNNRPNTIECGQLVESIWKGKILPKGKWIRWHEKVEKDGCTETILHCKCSECNTEYDPYSSQFINYCPICGARMEDQNG